MLKNKAIAITISIVLIGNVVSSNRYHHFYDDYDQDYDNNRYQYDIYPYNPYLANYAGDLLNIFDPSEIIGAITCIVSCVTQNLDGRCHHIFSCSWECFSRDTPPPIEETQVQSYIALASSRALNKAKLADSVRDNFETRQILPPIDFEDIIKFFKCVTACLRKHIPVDLLSFGAFLFCIVTKCICGKATPGQY